MRTRLTIAMLLRLVTEAAAQSTPVPAPKADSAWLDPGWRRTVDRSVVTFETTGLDRRTTDFEYRAVDERGARAVGRQVFPYDSYFEDLTISDLATIKADGRVIPVDDRAIKDQPVSADAASHYFDERRMKVVAFADVEAGDSVRGHLAYTAKRAILPGAYTGVWAQRLDAPPGVMEVTVDGPASMPLRVAARGASVSVESRGDRVIRHAMLRNDVPRPTSDATDGFDTAHRFEISTFEDDAALAETIAARNAPMAVPDEGLKRLSADIVGGAATVRDKVERIHNWVARNIRYVGIGFEDGGLTSQPATAVLAAHYADCKGHVTILKALVSAQGILADLVVVNAESRYTLTDVPTPTFDHAIAYVPALDLYLDPTAAMVAFGSLPSKLYGKPVLDIDGGRRAVIPVLKADDFALGTNVRYVLQHDGTRQVTSVLSGTGVGATVGRSYASAIESIDRAQVAARALTSAGLSGTYAFPYPRYLSDGFAIAAPFTVTKPVDLTKRTAVRMLALTDPRPAIWSLATGAVTDAAFECSSITIKRQHHSTCLRASPSSRCRATSPSKRSSAATPPMVM